MTTILLVEDDWSTLELMQFVLERAGYLVTCAEDGVEALERIRDGPVDLILCDFMMPRMDGVELARMIRSQGNPVPILLASSLLQADISPRFDYDAYLQKPFPMEVCLARIEALLTASGFAVLAAGV